MAFKWRPKWRVFALLFLMEVVCGNHMYTQYSPKSSHNDRLPQVLLRTEQDNIAFRLEPSLDSIPVEPSRITRSINVDEIPLTDNEIDKEIVVHKHGYFIEPTVAIDYHSSGFGDKLEFTYPGEGLRAPRGRALPAETKVRPTAVHRDQRQNTEIHKIITGIVKLLNGNVNVQANTLNSRPMSSRINNRGPPRISEAAVPEYEAFVPAKTPPPYPFDRPPMEQMPARPFHRPLPNWQRRRPPNRRPNPGLPVYNPHGVRPIEITTEGMDAVVKTTEKMDVVEEVTGKMETTTGLVTAVVKKEDANVADVKYEENLTDKKNEVNLTDKKDTYKKHVESPTDKNDENVTDKKHVESPTDKNDENLTDKKHVDSPTDENDENLTDKKDTYKKNEVNLTDKKDTYKKNEVNLTDKKDTYKKNEESPTDKKEENLTDKKDKKDEVSLTYKMETMNNDFNIIQPSIIEVSIDATSSTDVISSTLSVTPNADVVIEKTPINTRPLATSEGVPYPYRPRPGIVLDDTDFKPHGTRHRDAPVITAPENLPGYGEIFDVTVSAIQGPGEKGSVHIEHINIHNDDIIVSPSGEQGFVSIDGKRTYLNLFDTSTSISPTRVQTQKQTQTVPPQAATQLGTGVAVPAVDVPVRRPHRPPTYRRPQPTVRIDTCIVGDDSTCDQAQNEKCRTEAGISSCQCRPGYARRVHRDPCRRVVSLLLELRVDRLYDRKVVWDLKLLDKDSEPYQQLSYESIRAIDSAFSMTPFSDDFVSGTVNSIHKGDDNHVFVNYTVLMQETGETVRTAVGNDIQKHILGVIRRRSNNVGTSAIWVESPAGSVLPLKDVDECSSPDLNDCHKLAVCINTWGAFKCKCSETTLDPSASLTRSGRDCRECSSSHCNERGNCRYNNGQPYCSCSSGYYGSSCEVDGEVVGVAVGASLAAALVIALTLTALTAWSRKWSREQKALGMGSPVFNYMASNTVKTPPVGQPPYQVTLEERMRWAQIAEAMAQANHYAQPEPAQMATRPSSAMFGYPTLPPVPLPRLGLHGTINTMNSRINSSHNLYGYSNHMASESTSSDASSHVQDRADLLVPRPKSRARSVHNQNGLYYDVEYENAPEPIYGTKGIPLSTYTVSRGPPFYR